MDIDGCLVNDRDLDEVYIINIIYYKDKILNNFAQVFNTP